MRLPSLRPNALDPASRSLVRGYDQLPPEKKEELAKLNAACKDFESIFVFQLMKEMRKTVNKTRLVHGGFAEEVFTDMLDQERSRSYSLGISNILFKQLSQAIVPPPRRR
ncbi:MAG: hypothetical protein OZSIB_3058 [Candidatus Ozemobacter sibiricus]|uniref:Flagellar protein FlgJ N-terminal domain-containing protein n=1 Tax=Candidatus Ozemobacter sibiricus TaxID=2268124 RepID=A0A367ZHB9_9BACT|nr:MAG: hypothetical protein OZSIB_3058 [Candidatus Ozemobacter sibiricus]